MFESPKSLFFIFVILANPQLSRCSNLSSLLKRPRKILPLVQVVQKLANINKSELPSDTQSTTFSDGPFSLKRPHSVFLHSISSSKVEKDGTKEPLTKRMNLTDDIPINGNSNHDEDDDDEDSFNGPQLTISTSPPPSKVMAEETNCAFSLTNGQNNKPSEAKNDIGDEFNLVQPKNAILSGTNDMMAAVSLSTTTTTRATGSNSPSSTKNGRAVDSLAEDV